MVLPGCMFDRSSEKPACDPAVTAVPPVVVSDSALDIEAASWST